MVNFSSVDPGVLNSSVRLDYTLFDVSVKPNKPRQETQEKYVILDRLETLTGSQSPLFIQDITCLLTTPNKRSKSLLCQVPLRLRYVHISHFTLQFYPQKLSFGHCHLLLVNAVVKCIPAASSILIYFPKELF